MQRLAALREIFKKEKELLNIKSIENAID